MDIYERYIIENIVYFGIFGFNTQWLKGVWGSAIERERARSEKWGGGRRGGVRRGEREREARSEEAWGAERRRGLEEKYAWQRRRRAGARAVAEERRREEAERRASTEVEERRRGRVEGEEVGGSCGAGTEKAGTRGGREGALTPARVL